MDFIVPLDTHKLRSASLSTGCFHVDHVENISFPFSQLQKNYQKMRNDPLIYSLWATVLSVRLVWLVLKNLKVSIKADEPTVNQIQPNCWQN